MTGPVQAPLRGCSRAEGNYGQRLLALSPQPVHRVPAQQPSQPGVRGPPLSQSLGTVTRQAIPDGRPPFYGFPAPLLCGGPASEEA
jgi:hypothetical protein